MLSHIQCYPESRVCFSVAGFTLVLPCLWSGYVSSLIISQRRAFRLSFLFLFVYTLRCQPSSSSSFSELVNKAQCLGRSSFMHVKLILWSPGFTFIAFIFIKLPWEKNCYWSRGQQFSSLLLLIALSALPLNTTTSDVSQARKWGPVLDIPPLPCCLYVNSSGFCRIDFSQEKEPFLTPPRLWLSPLCVVSNSWLNVIPTVPSSEVTVPFSGILPSWFPIFEVL